MRVSVLNIANSLLYKHKENRELLRHRCAELLDWHVSTRYIKVASIQCGQDYLRNLHLYVNLMELYCDVFCPRPFCCREVSTVEPTLFITVDGVQLRNINNMTFDNKNSLQLFCIYVYICTKCFSWYLSQW